jgi:hypothetical protein
MPLSVINPESPTDSSPSPFTAVKLARPATETTVENPVVALDDAPFTHVEFELGLAGSRVFADA